ncbi:MAG: DUF2807 domain-containing protein [Saprospiraceae bacterium]|uniref:DUF2807 domain-containing protein n=1 Tax=Candidatus Opimibacter skivensis TaxID=2982028 RepID=A0A9D7SYT6_9BACT|nr:DUF2807 domain-containing protein [Candidatus Opimibacter skivensis]
MGLLLSYIRCSVLDEGMLIKGEGEVVETGHSLESPKESILHLTVMSSSHRSKQKITIEGQKNIIDNIIREVRNGVWHIAFDKSVKEAKDVTVYITLPKLQRITMSGRINKIDR